jgi:hypothetical protein
MSRRLFLIGLLLGALPAATAAQTFTPQSSTGLIVTFSAEKEGGTRVLVFGEVRNITNLSADRVVVAAEGLDAGGRVVSRGRAYVQGTIPSRRSSSFEIRLLSSGSEKRYRVQVESFQFVESVQGN